METIYRILAALAVFAATFLDIPKVRVNLWGLIGRAVNREMLEKLTALDGKMDRHIQADDQRHAVEVRTRILRFDEELLLNGRHTKEHFDQILGDITYYDNYCREHPTFKNQITVHASENITRVYDKCKREHSFLAYSADG